MKLKTGGCFDLMKISCTASGNLIKLIFKHPIKATIILKGVNNWSSNYFGAQKNTKEKDKYLVYTEFDGQIPFIPSEDITYTYTFAQLSTIAQYLCTTMPKENIKKIAECFFDLNELGADAFNKHPTITPRFTDHDRFILNLIQKFDKPTNCCPSLHIAYSVLLDNIGDKIIKYRNNNEKEKIFGPIREMTSKMFNSVLYTKQHSLIDIAFGILCSKIVFEKIFSEQFNDLRSLFDFNKSKNPQINYNEIEKVYSRSLDIYKKTNNFADSIGHYLEEKGFIKIGPEYDPNQIYFDTKKRKLVSLESEVFKD